MKKYLIGMAVLALVLTGTAVGAGSAYKTQACVWVQSGHFKVVNKQGHAVQSSVYKGNLRKFHKVCIKGTPGPQGATGATGAQGPKGDTGATGPAGPAGKDGANGTNGVNGTNGKDGLDSVLAPFGPSLNDGYSGWRMSSDTYDAQVVANNFLQISDAVASGSFGDWVFSPKVKDAQNTFDAEFDIKAAPGARNTADAGQWNHISISPDDGQGGRMSYLRFENQPDGIHVFFDDVTDAGPVGTMADFNESDIATLNPDVWHLIRFSINLSADQAQIYIDGSLAVTGTTWKNYYLYDPEQTPSGNVAPATNSLIFQARGQGDAADLGKGYLISGVRLASN